MDATPPGPDLCGSRTRPVPRRMQDGLEGMVSKRADRPYRAGRSKDWVKQPPGLGSCDGLVLTPRAAFPMQPATVIDSNYLSLAEPFRVSAIREPDSSSYAPAGSSWLLPFDRHFGPVRSLGGPQTGRCFFQSNCNLLEPSHRASGSPFAVSVC